MWSICSSAPKWVRIAVLLAGKVVYENQALYKVFALFVFLQLIIKELGRIEEIIAA
jgi:hypothetical protein